MRIEDIHWHDSLILAVVLDPEKDTLQLQLSYPVDWDADNYEDRVVLFSEAHGYKEFEGPFVGSPTILGASIAGSNEHWQLLRLDTNAGYREVFFKEVALMDPDTDSLTSRSTRSGAKTRPPG